MRSSKALDESFPGGIEGESKGWHWRGGGLVPGVNSLSKRKIVKMTGGKDDVEGDTCSKDYIRREGGGGEKG